MSLDLVVTDARLPGRASPVSIGIRAGRVAEIAPAIVCDAPRLPAGGRLAIAGFVDSHVHLDKACLLGRCGHDHGDLKAAIAAVSALKRDFTEDDVYARGRAASTGRSGSARRTCAPMWRWTRAPGSAASRRCGA